MAKEHTRGRVIAKGLDIVEIGDQGCRRRIFHVNGEIQSHAALNAMETSANAAELARRWNAFEPGGEVEEMRAALEALMEAEPMQTHGERNGAIMGYISIAITKARAVLASLNP